MIDYLSDYPGALLGRKASDWRKLIGKQVVYIQGTDVDHTRGIFTPRTMTVTEVAGKNVRNEHGDYLWLPHIFQAKLLENPIARLALNEMDRQSMKAVKAAIGDPDAGNN